MSKQKLENLWKPKQLDLFEEQEKTTGIFFGGIAPEPKDNKTAADILAEMAQTYRERNAVYGDNYKMVAKLVAVLFPNGVPSELVITDQWHLFELILVKLSRYAISNLTHQDSIHDAGVYCAMNEEIILNKEAN